MRWKKWGNVCNISVGNPQRKNKLRGSKCRLEDNNKMDFKEIE
jgi:hypothetical protein